MLAQEARALTAEGTNGDNPSPAALPGALGIESARDGTQDSGLPEVGIVIPAYKQPEYLKEAAFSAISQSMAERVKVVIVNDGCPYPSTDAVGRFFRSAFPQRVCYMRKPNGGLSSARNHGIRLALSAWPSIRAIFPLDSDNRLTAHTVSALYEALTASGEDVGWIYQDQARFGSDEHTWHVGVPFSRYRLLFENFSDAGSLISRRVFDRGVWYDESMKDGYEDWEFFIHATTRGFRGEHRANTGFRYRIRDESMLAGAARQGETIRAFIRSKHRDAFRPTSLTRLEHSEMPRFALVTLDEAKVCQITAADCSGRELSLERFLNEASAWMEEEEPRSTYLPPVTILTEADVLRALDDSGLLPGMLFLLQQRLSERPFASFALRLAPTPQTMRAHLVKPGRADALALALGGLRSVLSARGGAVGRLRKLAKAEGQQLLMELGAAHLPEVGESFAQDQEAGGRRDLAEQLQAAMDRTGGFPTQVPRAGASPPVDRYVGSHSFFAAGKHLTKRETTFPYAGEDSSPMNGKAEVFFVTAWLRLGGVDQIVLNIARALAAAHPSCNLHLVVTEANEVQAPPNALEPFQTLTFLAGDLNREDTGVLNLLSGADVVVNAHSRSAYRVLPELKERASPVVVGMLQVIDFDKDGKPGGYPLVAAREAQNLVDYLVVPSQQLRRACRVFGVPEEKMRVVPNAPVVYPADLEEALSIVETKSRRSFSTENPVKVLFAGRFDRQKGFDRLPGIARRLVEADVPCQLRILGTPVLTDAGELPDIPGAIYVPPAVDPLELREEYEAADVFLLPSRWEGVPLSILEAMSFGAVTVSTDVGAIAEVVETGENGVLVSGLLGEDEIIGELASAVAAFACAPERYLQLRRHAARTAMSFTWTSAAARLAALFPSSR